MTLAGDSCFFQCSLLKIARVDRLRWVALNQLDMVPLQRGSCRSYNQDCTEKNHICDTVVPCDQQEIPKPNRKRRPVWKGGRIWFPMWNENVPRIFFWNFTNPPCFDGTITWSSILLHVLGGEERTSSTKSPSWEESSPWKHLGMEGLEGFGENKIGRMEGKKCCFFLLSEYYNHQLCRRHRRHRHILDSVKNDENPQRSLGSVVLVEWYQVWWSFKNQDRCYFVPVYGCMKSQVLQMLQDLSRELTAKGKRFVMLLWVQNVHMLWDSDLKI